MRIRLGYRIGFEARTPTPMILMLKVRPERLGDLREPEVLTTDPAVATHDYLDHFGNTCTRLLAPAGRITVSADFLIEDSGEPDPVLPDLPQHAVEDLPDETLIFLLGSRYCETDPLVETAWRLFGNVAPGWPRVQAICDYVHDRIAFNYDHASPMRTAYGAHQEGRGVCRDYAHLAIALCRCMNIPARYCTGYLPDIGVPATTAPNDFGACFQAYLGGGWRIFDARNNEPRIGRILTGIGRDATDVAISTAFGARDLVDFLVIADQVFEQMNA